MKYTTQYKTENGKTRKKEQAVKQPAVDNKAEKKGEGK